MKRQARRMNVFVLMGGPSAEHEISLKTGAMVLKNLDRKKFNAVPILISKSGDWLGGGRSSRMLLATTRRPSETAHSVLGSLVPPAATHPACSPAHVLSEHTTASSRSVAFIAMHGPYGEDGTIQSVLELAGIPYTGSSVAPSAIAMNKVLSLKIFAAHGLNIPKGVAFSKTEWQKDKTDLRKKIFRLGYPLVVKPSNLGSSVGMTIVRKATELAPALKIAFAHSAEVMVEEYIKGRELTCGIIDKGIPGTETALLPTEIIPKTSTFFDYHAKYTPGASDEITPPRLPKPIIKKTQQVALACHRAIGCSGMSRTDLILSKGKLYLLEINTIPGMTTTSLLPQGAKACGISFPQLLEQVIIAALNRSRYNKS